MDAYLQPSGVERSALQLRPGRTVLVPRRNLSPDLPAIIFSSPETFELGTAGFANGRTNETQWRVAERIDYLRGAQSFKFGFKTNQSLIELMKAFKNILSRLVCKIKQWHLIESFYIV